MKLLICKYCGKEFEVYPYREKTAKYCSVSCGVKVNRPRWRGGRILKPNGYIMVNVNGKYIYEHRHIFQKQLKRKLKRTEVIHHIDGDRTNNKLSNLKLFSKRKHDSLETKKRWENNPESFKGGGAKCTRIK